MIANRTEFAQKLNSIVIPSNLSIDEQMQRNGSIQQAASEILPVKLYRFRNCTDRSFSAFDRDELWVSTADCMNDGFDTRLYMDKQQVNEAILQLAEANRNKEAFLNSVGNIPMASVFQEALEKVKSLSEETYQSYTEQIIKFMVDDTAQALSMLPSVGQQTIKFCCFSERITSPSMWGLYASDESGFALEYDFRDPVLAVSPNPSTSRECSLFPVIYGKERYQVSTEYIVFLLQYRMINTALINSGVLKNNPALAKTILASGICPDLSVATKISLHKSNEWEREAEWRLFCTSANDYGFQTSKHGCCIKKPTAIYLGRRISPINEKILRNLAQNKSIPVYKMKLDDESSSYELAIM